MDIPLNRILVSGWIEIIAVAVGGAVGSTLRFLISRLVQGLSTKSYFPWGILTVNLVGSLLIGILFGILIEKFSSSVFIRSLVFLGLLGGFTTFSSFTMDVITLFDSGANGLAILYIFASVGLGILATWIGLQIIRIIL